MTSGVSVRVATEGRRVDSAAGAMLPRAEVLAVPEPESLPPGQSVNARLPTAPHVQATMLERLSAVHALLSVERQATEYDIVITTVLEALRPGPMTDLDLLVEVRRVWPGAGLSAARLDAAVSVASRAGYVARVSEQAERTWTL